MQYNHLFIAKAFVFSLLQWKTLTNTTNQDHQKWDKVTSCTSRCDALKHITLEFFYQKSNEKQSDKLFLQDK